MDYIFKILKYGEEYHILLCSGEAHIVSLDEVRDYILSYDLKNFKKTTNPAMIRLLDDYKGEVMAVVTESGKLEFYNADFVREIMTPDDFPYFTVDEYAEYHSKKRAMVNRYCNEGRITGAIKIGKIWLIPKNALYPESKKIAEYRG